MENKQTLEEAAYQARRDYQDEVGKDGMNNCIMLDAIKIEKGFIMGAKWQQEQSTHIGESNEMVTAVEWLEKEINARGPIGEDVPTWLKELYEKAKAMEKEQMEKIRKKLEKAMESKQTAVEWLIDYIKNLETYPYKTFEELKQQAKEMEKEQIINALGVGCQIKPKGLMGYYEMGEQYYEETYKK